jgi:hypothetical protein
MSLTQLQCIIKGNLTTTYKQIVILFFHNLNLSPLYLVKLVELLASAINLVESKIFWEIISGNHEVLNEDQNLLRHNKQS